MVRNYHDFSQIGSLIRSESSDRNINVWRVCPLPPVSGKSENFYRSWSEVNGTKRKRSIQREKEKEKEKANDRKDNLKLSLKKFNWNQKVIQKERMKKRDIL